MLHAQACVVQNIRSFVSTVLDPSSTGCARSCIRVLLTLKCYDLVDHVLSDVPPINDPVWERMESIIISWFFGMITSELQDIAKEHDIAAHQIWLTLKHQFIGNNETRTLHLDATFRNFVLGDLSVSDYCRKLKSMADSLGDLVYMVSYRNLILNVLRGLNKQYNHLQAIITCSMPFPTFHKV
jgi:hypothetical protein